MSPDFPGWWWAARVQQEVQGLTLLRAGVVLLVGPPGGEDPLRSAGGRGGYLTCIVDLYCVQVLSYLLAHLEEKIPFVQLGAEVGIWPVLSTCIVYRWCPTCWPTWTISLCLVWGRGGYLTCAVYRWCPVGSSGGKIPLCSVWGRGG